MAVNTTDITNTYNSLFTAMVTKYDEMWTANEIDAETYAKLVGQASSQLVQLSADLVQKQEALEKDNALKQAQIDVATKEVDLKSQQIALAKAQADREYVITLATVDKELGYTYTLDVEDNIVRSSLSDSATGKIDYEVANIQSQGKLLEAQEKLSYTDRVLKDKQAAKLGLDNIMKLSEASRDADVNFKYSPNYETV